MIEEQRKIDDEWKLASLQLLDIENYLREHGVNVSP